MRHQFVLDKRSKQILDDLAQYRGGNRSREARLDKIGADPAFQERMQRSDEDIRAGRVVSHEEVKRRLKNTAKNGES